LPPVSSPPPPPTFCAHNAATLCWYHEATKKPYAQVIETWLGNNPGRVVTPRSV
jgi:hypothetical protein